MKIDIAKYTNRVIEDFTNTRGATTNADKCAGFNNIVNNIVEFIGDHTIAEYDVNVLEDGGLIEISIDIGYFYEDIPDSAFVSLIGACKRFDIHPGKLSMITFTFDGVWDFYEQK